MAMGPGGLRVAATRLVSPTATGSRASGNDGTGTWTSTLAPHGHGVTQPGSCRKGLALGLLSAI